MFKVVDPLIITMYKIIDNTAITTDIIDNISNGLPSLEKRRSKKYLISLIMFNLIPSLSFLIYYSKKKDIKKVGLYLLI